MVVFRMVVVSVIVSSRYSVIVISNSDLSRSNIFMDKVVSNCFSMSIV